MKTLLTFTMTPTEPMVTILAGTLIIAGVALLVTYILLHQARTEREQAIRNAMMWTDEARGLKKELDAMRSERNAIEDELTAAKSDIEWERVMRKQKSESKEYWKAKAVQAFEDIEQWKALYIEQLNRANRFEELHQRMTKRPRDPKTGRIISKSKAVSDAEVVKLCDEIKQRAVEDVTITEEQFLAHMRGEDPAHDDTHGLTVRKLCDEARENANAGL
jgi:uncharacterized protein (DUF3084 family)